MWSGAGFQGPYPDFFNRSARPPVTEEQSVEEMDRAIEMFFNARAAPTEETLK